MISVELWSIVLSDTKVSGLCMKRNTWFALGHLLMPLILLTHSTAEAFQWLLMLIIILYCLWSFYLLYQEKKGYPVHPFICIAVDLMLFVGMLFLPEWNYAGSEIIWNLLAFITLYCMQFPFRKYILFIALCNIEIFIYISLFLEESLWSFEMTRFYIVETSLMIIVGKVSQIFFRLAFLDQLTALPNRAYFRDQLDSAVHHSEKHRSSFAILFIDLDRFKNINDSLGHSIGDQLLQDTSERVKTTLERGITFARIGGDEFTVLVKNKSKQELSQLAAKLLDILDQPLVLAGHELRVLASIGIAIYPEHGKDAETLMKNCDAAMYQAKVLRNDFRFYTNPMSAKVDEQFSIENNLYKALENNEFFLVYQPRVDMKSGRVNSVEALLRWDHPITGMIPPQKFIPVAEENGIITAIDQWVLRTGCKQLKKWTDEGYEFGLSLNMSARQFYDENLIHHIRHVLDEEGIDRGRLEIEITENVLMNNFERIRKVMCQLSSIGLKITIDDFGTGYSSLAYLKEFPVSALKIDKSFLYQLASESKNQSILKSIIDLSKNLNMISVAEGIENEHQLALLRAMGCDEAQGFLFCRPVTEQLLKDYLHQRQDLKLVQASDF